MKEREPGKSAIITTGDLAAYYERKTPEILRRYGPGPRVHYHTGFVAKMSSIGSRRELRSELVKSQERMLEYAAEIWQVRRISFRDILDVGCGLGGGAIYWAQNFDANVTAITIAPSHVAFVAKFATEAGVESRVRPLLSDALTLPGENLFDAAIAIDSSSSFPRDPWFERLAGLLRPGGHVFIFDCFLHRPEYADEFNKHWCAQIGTLDEYRSAGNRVGFELQVSKDVSREAFHFWTMTASLLQKEAEDLALNFAERDRLIASASVHSFVRKGLLNGGLRHMLLTFAKIK